MTLLRELAKMKHQEDKLFLDIILDIILDAIKNIKVGSLSYEEVVNNIAKIVRKNDKSNASSMSDEALTNLIKLYFEEGDMNIHENVSVKHDPQAFIIMDGNKEVGCIWYQSEDKNWALYAKRSKKLKHGFSSKEEAVEWFNKNLTITEDEDISDDEVFKPRVIAKADQFRVELISNEQVNVLNGKNQILVTMPLIIWQQLARS